MMVIRRRAGFAALYNYRTRQASVASGAGRTSVSMRALGASAAEDQALDGDRAS